MTWSEEAVDLLAQATASPMRTAESIQGGPMRAQKRVLELIDKGLMVERTEHDRAVRLDHAKVPHSTRVHIAPTGRQARVYCLTCDYRSEWVSTSSEETTRIQSEHEADPMSHFRAVSPDADDRGAEQ